jgi:hypothetical protein
VIRRRALENRPADTTQYSSAIRLTAQRALVQGIAMARFLIILGLAILLTGLLWPYLSRLGLGRLPGDIVIERDNVTLYFPIVTSLILSLSISLVLWFLSR